MNFEEVPDYKYQTLVDILAEMVMGYISKHLNSQKEELQDANNNRK